MDIPFLVLALAAGLLLPRSRALLAAAALWAIAVAFVGWGPAHNSDVHTGSLGFWGPWLIVGVIGLGLAAAASTLRARRRNATS
jgi:membrane protein DedA with SNARE-associated domain